MAGITHLLGYRNVEELRAAAADFQLLGYTTVQVGPTDHVTNRPKGSIKDWDSEAGKRWYVLLATKDPVTDPAASAGD